MISIKSMVVGIVVVAVASTAHAQSATIAGVVQGSAGNPLGGVTVLYRSLPEVQVGPNRRPVAVPPAVNSQTVTNVAGIFRVAALPPGTYYVCSLAAAPGQLSSCNYGSRPTVVSIGSGEVASVTLTNRTGAIIWIQVLDPTHAIAGGQHFALGSRATDGTYEFAKLSSQVPGEFVYALTIPNDRTSRLVVDAGLVVTDTSGNAVATKQPALLLPTNVPSSNITIVVK